MQSTLLTPDSLAWQSCLRAACTDERYEVSRASNLLSFVDMTTILLTKDSQVLASGVSSTALLILEFAGMCAKGYSFSLKLLLLF